MNIYFVRHGESTENALQIYDWMESSLTEKGIEQSKLVANRLKNTKIEKIFCSDMLRAKMTAIEINKLHNVEIEESVLIREQLPPSELLGKSENDEYSKKVSDLLYKNQHINNYHYSNEENFDDLKLRVFKFLKEIEKTNFENIVVIGHGHVLRTLIGYVLYGKNYNSHDFESLRHNLKTTNTGITICEVSDNKEWMLLTWNDHSHLFN